MVNLGSLLYYYNIRVQLHPVRSDRQDRPKNVGVAGTKLSLSISYDTYNLHAVGPIVAAAGASRRPAPPARLAAAASLARRASPKRC